MHVCGTEPTFPDGPLPWRGTSQVDRANAVGEGSGYTSMNTSTIWGVGSGKHAEWKCSMGIFCWVWEKMGSLSRRVRKGRRKE